MLFGKGRLPELSKLNRYFSPARKAKGERPWFLESPDVERC